MDKFTTRGLRYGIDKVGTRMISKPEFKLFWKRWDNSGKTMKDYLLELHDKQPPIKREAAKACGNAAMESATTTAGEAYEAAKEMAAVKYSNVTSFFSETASFSASASSSTNSPEPEPEPAQ
jgi:hypothetical protein